MTIEDNIFAYKPFNKRNMFPFFTVHMPFLPSNILLSILYGSLFSEFHRIAQCMLRLTDFVSRASQLYTRMVTKGGKKAGILCQIKKQSKDTLKCFPSIPRYMTK